LSTSRPDTSGKRQVEQQHVDRVLPQLFHRFTARTCLGDHREIGCPLIMVRKAGTDDLVVVDNHDSGAIHGPGLLHNLLSILVHCRSLPL
jgi:hypothetical protein